MLQSTVKKLGEPLGYFHLKDAGVCRGVDMAWISASIMHNERRFLDVVSRIDTDTDGILAEIERVNQKIARQEQLTESDEKIFEILAVMEQIVLYQDPYNLGGLYSESLNQGKDKMIEFLLQRPDCHKAPIVQRQ